VHICPRCHQAYDLDRSSTCPHRYRVELLSVRRKVGLEVDTLWKRINGRERVRVGRVWLWPDQGWTVRAHPVTGGRYLVADAAWFLEHYTPADAC
jgi:hypothetical protein